MATPLSQQFPTTVTITIIIMISVVSLLAAFLLWRLLQMSLIANIVAVPTVFATFACKDKSSTPGAVSDCPSRQQLCDNPIYRDLMTEQCPLTCGRCTRQSLQQSASSRQSAANCADRIGPRGMSDCPSFPERCTDPVWMGLMAQECPLTCGRCPPRRLPPPPPPLALPFSASQALQFFNYPELVSSISRTLRPCDDFYEYVCEGYRKDRLRQLAPNKPAIHQIEEKRDEADQMIIELLTSAQHRQRYRANPLFAGAYTFFDACVDMAARERDQRPMEAMFDELRSVRTRMGAQYTLNTDWLRAVYPAFAMDTKYPEFGPMPSLVFPFLWFRPIPLSTARSGQFAGNENAFLFELAIPEPIPDPRYYDDMAALMGLVFNDDLHLNGQSSPVLAPAGTSPGDRAALEQAGHAWADKVHAVDQQWSQIFNTFNSTTADQYEQMTLRDISQQLTPAVDWPAFLADIDSRLGPNTKVMVKCRQCFVDMATLIGDIGTRNADQLRGYLETFVVHKHSNGFDSRFGALTWGRPIPVPGIPPRISLASICMARAATHFEKQLDRLFIDNHFGTQSRARVIQMIDQARAEFRLMLSEADWMAESSRQRALNKLDRMGAVVGYFDQIRDDTVLTQENSCYNLDSSMSFGQMELLALGCTNKRNLQTVVLVDDQQQLLFYLDEYVRSFEPNGLYQPSRNIFVVLSGILQLPFFSVDLPEAAQFGGVGVLIAHEITHGFDNKGRRYNEQGRLENWWEPATEQAFNQRSQCFVNQYSNYRIRLDERTEQPVDGQLTLSENIPDNGGLKAALRTLQRNNRNGQKMPRKVVRGLERLSDEQLFFLNYAFTFCSIQTSQSAEEQLHADVHSPPRARVNLAVANSPIFSRTFSCKEGDRMHLQPAQRCELW